LFQRLAILLLAASAACAQHITGFSDAAAVKQAEIEKKFQAIPQPENLEKLHKWLTAEPHPAGSERNNQLAREMAEMWRQQGMDEVKVQEYDVLVSYPRELVLEMVSPKPYRAGLREEPYDVDPDTKNPNVKPGYISLSASGEVTAPIVYAASGNPEDYALLKKHGIDVKGKVVLVRYSNPYSYRGFKALTAQKLGVAALLIYSDPQEDGYKKGKVFPDGPWGPESHIQRGAITYDFMVAGDPLTPGWASVPGAKHISPDEAVSMPHIMAMALSWKDAKPLLENMGGPAAPKAWQGGLPITYRMGGVGKVHVKIDMDTGLKPNYVVEARIKGAELPGEWIVLGNHRDAWEFGGVDPSSGTASMLEMTRAFGELLKQGIRPRRTLIFCSWDGEEVGLTGSTEWGEDNAEDLQKHAIAYLNVDSSVAGPDFSVSAVASLGPALVELSKSVTDPGSGGPLYEAWKKSVARANQNNSPLARSGAAKKIVTDDDLVETRIGSGSDHTVFLCHLGIPVANLAFDGPYGVYHSMYDDHFWMEHFGDPGFKYHAAMSRYWGLAGLRLANAEVLPLDFENYAKHIRRWVEEVEKKPGAKEHLEFGDLLRGVERMERDGKAAKTFAKEVLESQTKRSDTLPDMDQNRMSHAFNSVERGWLLANGIPGRPWFKHTLYASRFTYAHLELPGLTEAVEGKNWKVAEEQLSILQTALANACRSIDFAARNVD
jgi:N-acetylated-alpha-linked acidic dipeptidase